MKDDELIRTLRGMAKIARIAPFNDQAVLNEAADRIEDLSERIAIMAADMDQTWGESYCTASGAAVFVGGDKNANGT